MCHRTCFPIPWTPRHPCSQAPTLTLSERRVTPEIQFSCKEHSDETRPGGDPWPCVTTGSAHSETGTQRGTRTLFLPHSSTSHIPVLPLLPHKDPQTLDSHSRPPRPETSLPSRVRCSDPLSVGRKEVSVVWTSGLDVLNSFQCLPPTPVRSRGVEGSPLLVHPMESPCEVRSFNGTGVKCTKGQGLPSRLQASRTGYRPTRHM